MATRRAFGTIRKLSSGRYQARYWHLGRQISAGTSFATKADARAWLSGVETDLLRRDHFDPAVSAIPFGEYAREWMDNRALRPRTRETYESQLKHILPTFKRAELNSVSPTDVRSWYGRLVRSGLSPNTTAKVYRLFRTIMSTAVDDGLLRSNPVSIRGAAAERSIERPLLTWDEVARLADAIEPRYRALVWTAATSGLRFGELTALDRSRIDLDTGKIRVDRALGLVKGQGPVVGPPKSDAAHRVVAIPAQTCELLRIHLDEYTATGARSLVFTSLTGRPLVNGYFKKEWSRARIRAGVDESVRFHDLRHLAGTAAATAGASLREVMARMGHASSNASLRYLKAAEGRDQDIAQAIGQHIHASGTS